jgi:3-keto-disaccharide hydrolase
MERAKPGTVLEILFPQTQAVIKEVASMRKIVQIASGVAIFLAWTGLVASGKEQPPDGHWRSLSLITDGKVDQNWTHIGWGGFAVDNDSLRTEPDEKGMGFLLYKKERFGNCQIRVVYKTKDSKSNAGVFVRIDDGILKRLKETGPAIRRNPDGKLGEGSLEKLMEASEREQGVWYPVHHGYEVQIMDKSDEYHRTGAIYSLAKAAPLPNQQPADWKTMVITLKGNLVLVDVDGQRITSFDPDSKGVPSERKWFEPKREPKRPQSGFIGLQNHDPGDIVYFREVSIRSLQDAP